MESLVERIRERLAAGAFVNEAAVSIGIVIPVLSALGWDSADPDQIVPEYSSGRGRVDFALLGLAQRPAVFIEVKGVGRSLEGDRQLFGYAFHQGVPLCVLTDGREWSFYLPSGHGTYEDRRVYKLQLDDRLPGESVHWLLRYLGRERVRSGAVFEYAQRDYRDAAGRREAVRNLPRAWRELVAEPDDLLVDLVADRAETLCGFRPSADDSLAYLRSLHAAAPSTPPNRTSAPVPDEPTGAVDPATRPPDYSPSSSRATTYCLFGKQRNAAHASEAF